MAKLKRTDKRIRPGGAHPYFAENLDLWKQLKVGDTIEVPNDQLDSIVVIFGDSVVVVSGAMKKEKKPDDGLSMIMEESNGD